MTRSVTASRVILSDPAVSDSVAEHRTDYWTWVEQHAEQYTRRLLLGLRDYWRDCNRDYFDGRMLEPYVTLTEPSAPQLYGQCCSVSSWGSRLEIRLRPSLLAGTHPHLRSAARANCERFTYDVLLHEMIHQHVMEHEPDVDEDSYHGHGPVFTAHANRIGALLGLPEVAVRNRGADKKPKAAQWPHCVQPADRYGGAYNSHPRKVTASGDGAAAVAAPAEKISTWCGGRGHVFDSLDAVFDVLAANVGNLGTVIATLTHAAYRTGRTVKIPLDEAEHMSSQMKDLHAALCALLDNRDGGAA